jgi:hypothetical protein
MEDIIAKPIDSSAPVGSVADAPQTPTIPPIRQRIVGSLSRYPLSEKCFGEKYDLEANTKSSFRH